MMSLGCNVCLNFPRVGHYLSPVHGCFLERWLWATLPPVAPTDWKIFLDGIGQSGKVEVIHKGYGRIDGWH